MKHHRLPVLPHLLALLLALVLALALSLPLALSLSFALLPFPAPGLLAEDLVGPQLTVVDFSSEQPDPNGTYQYLAAYAVDGDPDTFWNNAYRPKAKPPHHITLDLGATALVTGFRYLPRQDGYSLQENGNLGPYRFLVSADGAAFDEVAAGAFDAAAMTQSTALLDAPVEARYVRLETDMEWIAVAELVILTGPPPGVTPTVTPGPELRASLSTDQPVYEQGEDIVVAFAGCRHPVYRIGICPADAAPCQGSTIKAWLYANSGTKTPGPVVVERGNVEFDGAAIETALVPGQYAAHLLAEDWTTSVATARFIVVEKGGNITPPTQPDPPAGLSYRRTVEQKGGAGGQVEIEPPADTLGLTGFDLYWGDTSGPLAAHTPIARVPYTGENPTRFPIPDGVAIPRGATRLLALSRSWDLVSDSFADVALDPGALLPESELLYSFQVLTDLHLATDAAQLHNRQFEAALRDLVATDPDSLGLFLVGDTTDHSLEPEWEEFARIVAAVRPEGSPPLYAALGNHDFAAQGDRYEDLIALYRRYTGAPGPYFRADTDAGVFLVLGSQSMSSRASGFADLGEDQLAWLEGQLSAVGSGGESGSPTGSSKESPGPVFVFLHQPLKDTVSGSLVSVDPSVQVWHGVLQDAALRALLDRYPNVVLFTGHTHWQFESLQPFLPGNGKAANYLNAASVAYLWTDANTERAGSQGYFVEVYADHVLVRGRDFIGAQWVSPAQFLLSIGSGGGTPSGAPSGEPSGAPSVGPSGTPGPDEADGGGGLPAWALALLVGAGALLVAAGVVVAVMAAGRVRRRGA